MKYCGNCGKELCDEEQICPRCKAEFVEFSYEIEEQIQKRKAKQKTKTTIIIAILIIVVILAGLKISGKLDNFISDFNKGYNEAVSEDEMVSSELATGETTDIKEATSFDNQESTIANNIEIIDLFNGLETVEKILGPQTNDSQDIEAYTRYTFDNVAVLCEYGTNNIYSIAVNYDSDEAKSKYTVLGIDGNSVDDDWVNVFGEMYYNSYDSNGVPVYSYETEYNGILYDIEITASSEHPDKISVWLVDY